MSLPPASIIGTGALGEAFLQAFAAGNLAVAGIYNRSPSTAVAWAERFPGARGGPFPSTVSELGELVLLTVPDGAVAGLARKLAGLQGDWTGRTVAHCSGSLTSEVLDPLADRGARTASFHPLQSFTGGDGPGHFKGIWFSTEGDPQALELLEKLAGRLEASLLRVRPEQKAHIHLAAVFASNYLVALAEAAGRAGSEGEGDPAELVRALGPLVRQAADNVAAKGTEKALSGPIFRGDAGTVEKHLELLEERPRLRELYRLLGQELLDLVKRSKKGLEPRTAAQLEKLLKR